MEKKTILIVDDSQINRAILTEMIKNEYSTLEAVDGLKALKVIENNKDNIDLILLDVVMPEMDGLSLLQIMHDKGWIEDLPVIMISSETASAYISDAYGLGASDYIARPYNSEIVIKRIRNTIALYSKKKDLKQEVARQVNDRQKENQMMINILSHIVETRNGESGAHVQNINIITRLIFNELFRISDKYDGFNEDLDLICTASSLHDIGKIAIPEDILNKPGKLTKEEFDVMKTHTLLGYNMINSASEQYKGEKLINYCANICLSHHEKWDGNGYPKGLKEDEIPIYAQIVSLADCYDALTSERCYKPAFSHEKAVEMIVNKECGTFNPLLIECLENISYKLKEVKK